MITSLKWRQTDCSTVWGQQTNQVCPTKTLNSHQVPALMWWNDLLSPEEYTVLDCGRLRGLANSKASLTFLHSHGVSRWWLALLESHSVISAVCCSRLGLGLVPVPTDGNAMCRTSSIWTPRVVFASSTMVFAGKLTSGWSSTYQQSEENPHRTCRPANMDNHEAKQASLKILQRPGTAV